MDDLDNFFSGNTEIAEQVRTEQPSSNKGNFNKYPNSNKKFFPKKEIDLNTFTIYKPISFIINPNAPEHIVTNLIQLKDILINNGFTIRLTSGTNADEALLKATKDDNPEIYLPWKDFNNIFSKFYFNDKVAQHVAKMFHRSYDTLKPPVQAFLARNVRMVLGEKLKANTLGLITWSEDGAEDINEVTFKTGNISHPISVAKSVYIPVFNIQKQDAIKRLIAHFKLKQPVSDTERNNGG